MSGGGRRPSRGRPRYSEPAQKSAIPLIENARNPRAFHLLQIQRKTSSIKKRRLQTSLVWYRPSCFRCLDPDPAIRARGTCPHLLCSKAASSWLSLLHGSLLFAPSWRTVVRVPLERDVRKRPRHPRVERVMQEQVAKMVSHG